MAHPIHRVHGLIVDADGQPAPDVVLAIVDEDLVSDDLIGVGLTNADGTFRLSFTPAAFNQELLEVEQTPDLYIVASVRHEGRLVPVCRSGLPALRWADGEEDAGTIRLPLRRGERPSPSPDVDPVPGWRKRVARLQLDDAVVSEAVSEVAPLVEALTGWHGILDTVRVETIDRAGEAYAAVLERGASTVLTGSELKSMARGLSLAGLVGLYDPFADAIFLDRRKLERQNLDGMKVLLGHELVHAAQFRAHGGMIETYGGVLRELLAADAEDRASGPSAPVDGRDVCDPALGPRARVARAATFGFMANLEGYASYVENDFLRKLYNCATPLPHHTLVESALLWLLAPDPETAAPVGEVRAMSGKADEYAIGREAYKARQQGDRPSRFDPELRPASPT